MLLRRVRGVLMSMLLGAVPWALLGVAIGIAIELGAVPIQVVVEGWPLSRGAPLLLGLIGAIVGAINGLIFALVMIAAERGRRIDELPWWRFALWGAASTAATVGFITRVPMIALWCVIPGAIAGAVAIRLARRVDAAAGPALIEPPGA